MIITKENSYLLITSLILLLIGGYIAFNPTSYLLQFNLEIQTSNSFLSELRAFGTGLLGVGLIAVISLFIPKLKTIALGASTIVFSFFLLGRMLGLITDGIPNHEILIASAIEMVFAFIGLYLLNKEVGLWS